MPNGELESSLGAVKHGDRVDFCVWAPGRDAIELELERQESVVMEPDGLGYFRATVDGLQTGARYRFRVGGEALPDPASRWQPEGVHGPSAVVDPGAFQWRWQPPRQVCREDASIYELHVGTFSGDGTFRSCTARLPYLKDLGVTAIELMPVGEFAGGRNWGYDPGLPFAPSHSYGTPDDLRKLVDEAHRHDLAVIMDVVYNHFGPDGAYFPAFVPPVLTDRHATPWGKSIDFDGEFGAGVRRYFLENALMWLREYRVDGLRLDATFAIIDESHEHFLAELAKAAGAVSSGRAWLIAEDPRNLRNLLLPADRGGLGLGGVWADDFHHHLRVRLAGDDRGYFRDFDGSSQSIAATVTGNWFYTGHHSRHHGVPRGTHGSDLPPEKFVVCLQNHDQVGNRALGERLHQQVALSDWRAASALLLFVPQTPLLFMGQEWAASTPFQYFTDHAGELGTLVSQGRREEFEDFGFGDEVPDPQDPATFDRSRLDWDELDEEPHSGVLRLYRDLLRVRRNLRGPVEVLEVSPGGLTLARSGSLLMVALTAGSELALPLQPTGAGARAGTAKAFDVPLLSTEDARYATDPLPPERSAGGWRFRTPGALLFRTAGE